jgi:hypothetical protein
MGYARSIPAVTSYTFFIMEQMSRRKNGKGRECTVLGLLEDISSTREQQPSEHSRVKMEVMYQRRG